ncbi:branched-chain amino acid transport system ATP-binding protein [Arboricoccus pini]|uniref:Branched-chain amino acid transport system ATP-binding protein n=1 Tax=Arboricoccus pini TaxID=1963835 RepID=A0A212RJG0_9PROT|nr:ABC transporter ATP-binding protein [Arboricoccus pini]SNB72570.1 branched-chain amino acid transport system ATP-binding protein [Arboricoccus pini]
MSDPSSLPPMPLLTVEGLVKRFGGVAAVDGISFTLEAGQIMGVIGPNGAGKTTLFDCLAGSQLPDAGQIRLAGQRIERLPAWRRTGIGLGRTFQIPRPFPAMSVLENVMLGAKDQAGERILPNWVAPGRVRRQEAACRERAHELLTFVTLASLSHAPAGSLSGGQRKLLELARALMAKPSLILLDEPAAGVNPALLEIIIERLLAMNRAGTTLLLIEHNIDMVARLCRHVLVMANGRPLAAGTPENVTSDPRVAEAYLGGAVA